jgi:hypothetical protein
MIYTKQSLLCGRKNHFPALFALGKSADFQQKAFPVSAAFFQKRGGYI